MKAILTVEIAALLAVGCVNSPSVDAHDRSCSTDSDCVVVASGDVCDCTCERSAVNRTASAAYQSEFDKNRDRCPGCNSQCYPRCPPNMARCTSGKCVAVPTTFDGGPSDSRSTADGITPCANTATCTKINNAAFCFDNVCISECPAGRAPCGSLAFPRNDTTTCCPPGAFCCSHSFESGVCQPNGTPCIYDAGAWIPDGFSFKCHALDAYESSLCDTNLPCVSVADCPKFAPIKCPGTWQCASATCKYRCPP